MEIHHATQAGCVIVTFTGSIDLFSVSAVQRTVLKDLAEQPDGLICDLSAVEHLDPVCATVFATVVNHPASRWPTTGFALCGAQPQVAELLGRLQVPDFLPLYATVDEALDAVVARPPYLRDELLLAPTPTAPAAARDFVRQVCRYWELALPDSTVVQRAVLLANELVTNAVVHAHTELQLRLELRGDRLHIAVRDGSPRLLRLVTAPTQKPRVAVGCGWWSSSPSAGGSTATPTAARSSGAPSTSDPHDDRPRTVPSSPQRGSGQMPRAGAPVTALAPPGPEGEAGFPGDDRVVPRPEGRS